MSTTGQAQIHADSDRSLEHDQGNWWGQQTDDLATDSDQPSGHDTRMDGSPRGYAEMQSRWKAFDILRDTTAKLCGEALSTGKGEEIELTDAELVPPVGKHKREDQCHFWGVRANPETGAMTGGYGTWVRLKDRPRERFMEIVEICLELWQQSSDASISSREADALRSKADQLKSIESLSDQQILTHLIRAVIAPVPVTEYSWPRLTD